MLRELVGKARRRMVHNELLCQGAHACSAALAVFLLLLVLGTQILNWYWLVVLPAAALGVALYRVRRRVPSAYAVAQRIDRRLELADALSTAVFFAGPEKAAGSSEELRRLQSAEADRLAETVDVRRAVPYVVPQSAYIAAALLLVASSVFALRYGLTDRLDLKQPLARILQERLGWGEKEQQARAETRKPDKVPVDETLADDNGQQANPNEVANQPQDPGDNADPQSQQSAGKASADKKNSQNQMQPDSSQQDQEDQAEDSSSEGQQNAANSKEGQKNGKDSQSGSNGDSKSSANQSLLSKMKEAMQNLLSSMQKPEQQQQNASNQNKSGKGQQNQGKQQAQKGDKKNGNPNESQEQQAADDGEQAQNAQGQSAEKSDSPMTNKQPGSGAGNRDGSKDVKQAEQLAAMGKISEIIGKRAANVTGEVTVDVEKTSQTLRTGYQERRAEHAQTGAEISRDEIPVALESYVEQYFEQVRKQPGKK